MKEWKLTAHVKIEQKWLLYIRSLFCFNTKIQLTKLIDKLWVWLISKFSWFNLITGDNKKIISFIFSFSWRYFEIGVCCSKRIGTKMLNWFMVLSKVSVIELCFSIDDVNSTRIQKKACAVDIIFFAKVYISRNRRNKNKQIIRILVPKSH